MERLTIVKVGGKVVEDKSSLEELLKQFSMIRGKRILVHGGGKLATSMAEKLGIETQMVEGRRITDAATLEVVTMVYAGLVNKTIVAGLQAKGCNSIGLTGADLNVIRAVKRPVKTVDYGFVGDIMGVNTSELRMLLNEEVVPVVAPITHDGRGQLLNTNADTIAADLAIELSNYYTVNLFYCFEKKGVLLNPNDENSVIPELNYARFKELQVAGTITEGMIPKLDNGFSALTNGVSQVLITNPFLISMARGTRLSLRND
ncbi:MAG TPA: acetylglutamate kinase [Prolixibacteraceae bacterium]|nr:acetylglutamate kinase [Prolixibacteraceae bacterium]